MILNRNILLPLFTLIAAALVTTPAQAMIVFDLTTCQEVKILDRSELQKPQRFRQDLLDDMILKMPASCDFSSGNTKEIQDILKEEEGVEITVFLSPMDQLIYFDIDVSMPYLWLHAT